MPNGTYGGVRGGLNSPYSIETEGENTLHTGVSCWIKGMYRQNYEIRFLQMFLEECGLWSEGEVDPISNSSTVGGLLY